MSSAAMALLARVRETLASSDGHVVQALADLFERERELPRDFLVTALGPHRLDDLEAIGLIAPRSAAIVGLSRLTRFRGLVLASDRFGFRRHPSFVLGPGPAGALLARVVRPIDRGRCLDLGSGCGIQALLLARGGLEAIGIDISPRAVTYARFNAALNEIAGARFEAGDFLTAPADLSLDGRFDVVVSNPPFVLAPTSQLGYRDRPLPGDEVCRVAVERVARALAAGGRGYVVGNWIGRPGEAWQARPTAWIAQTGLRGIVALVGSYGIEEYAAAWNRDLPEETARRATGEWVAALRAEGAVSVHMGVLALARMVGRRSGTNTRSIAMGSPTWEGVEEALAA